MKKVAIAVAAVVAGGLINSAQAEMYIGGKVGMTTLDNACYLNSPCDDDAFSCRVPSSILEIIPSLSL